MVVQTARGNSAWDRLGGAMLVANVHAGQAQEKLDRAIELLSAHGVPLDEIHTVAHIEQFQRVVQAGIDKGIKNIIIGGGDGTISTIVDDLLDKDVTMGVLPLGTANDFVRNLGLDPFDLDAACATIARGYSEKINLGCANGDYYLNVATIGLGAAVTREVTPEMKRSLGPLAYATAAVRTAVNYRPFAVRLTLENNDGHKAVHQFRAVQVAVANGRYHGGGMIAAPHADLSSSHLSVTVMGAMGAFEMGRVMLALRNGAMPQSERIRFYRAQKVTIETPGHAKSVNIDGELSMHTPVTFTLTEGAIPVFTLPENEREHIELY